MKLLTPAPHYRGQTGRHTNGTYWRATMRVDGRLVWKRIPWWNILDTADCVARQHLGQHFETLNTVKGISR